MDEHSEAHEAENRCPNGPPNRLLAQPKFRSQRPRPPLRSRSRSLPAMLPCTFEFRRKSKAAKDVEQAECSAVETHRWGHPTDQAQVLYRLFAFHAELAMRQAQAPRIEIQTSCSGDFELPQDLAMPYLIVCMQEIEVAKLDEGENGFERGDDARYVLITVWQAFRRKLREETHHMSKMTRFGILDLAAKFAGFVHAVTPFLEKPLVRYLLSTCAFQVHAQSEKRSLEREATKLHSI